MKRGPYNRENDKELVQFEREQNPRNMNDKVDGPCDKRV